jgi:hypothetical protein
MILVSDSLKSYIEDVDSRHFEAKLVVNGKDFSCDIRSLKIKKGSCGGSSLQPGTFFSSTVEAQIRTQSAIKHGDKIEVWISAPESGDESFYKVVTAYVRHPIRKMQEISFTAEGAIAAKLGLEFKGEAGMTVQAILNNVSIAAGVNIIVENDMDTSLVTSTSANLKGYLMREVLADIAGLFFGYACEDVDGNILIKKYGMSASADESVILKEERMKSYPDVYDTVTIGGIQVRGGEVDCIYPEGSTTVNCCVNNLLMTEEIFNRYVNDFIGLNYTPFEAEYSLGDFRIEPWDTVSVDGKSTIITEVTHHFDSGIKTQLKASTLESGEAFSRTTTNMQSDFSFEKLTFDMSVPDPVDPRDIFEVSDINASTTGGDANVFIKDNYVATLEISRGQYYGSNGIKYEPPSSLDAKYMPAYPVKVCVRGYTKSSSSWSSQYPIAVQIEILPELNTDGKVRMIYSASYLDPKGYSTSFKDYRYDPYTRNFMQYCYFSYRVQYLLKSYMDSIDIEEGSEST